MLDLGFFNHRICYLAASLKTTFVIFILLFLQMQKKKKRAKNYIKMCVLEFSKFIIIASQPFLW